MSVDTRITQHTLRIKVCVHSAYAFCHCIFTLCSKLLADFFLPRVVRSYFILLGFWGKHVM